MKAHVPPWLVLDPDIGDLERQIHHAIRDRILDGRLKPGDALPSCRASAAVLGVARSTVTAGYERLKAEGFIQSAQGAATRVAPLPQGLPGARTRSLSAVTPPAVEPERFLPFRPGLPDLSSFPNAAWSRSLTKRARHLRIHDLGYGGEAGLLELRQAIVEHVVRTRAVLTDPEQVIVMPSAAAIIGLLARLPSDGHDRPVWVEEPGYINARDILRAAGRTLVPIPCDGEGIAIRRGAGSPPTLIYVTPSHQYPTGVAMSLARRLDVLDVAATAGAIVIEDDYDSEYHYSSRPLAALQSIDRTGCVVYVGTFSKVMAPGLRVAYAVLPEPLLDPVRTVLRREGGTVSIHVQAALADFIRDGHLRAHIRRMRDLYCTRMMATRTALIETCASSLNVAPGDGGLQLAAWFRDERTDDRAVASHLQANGIGARALSPFHLGAARPGLLFGIASGTPEAVAKLTTALRGMPT